MSGAVPGAGSAMPPAWLTMPPHSVQPPMIDCPAGRIVADVLLVSSKSSEPAGVPENVATRTSSLSDKVIVPPLPPSVLGVSKVEQGPYVPTGKPAMVDALSGVLESSVVFVEPLLVMLPPHA